MQYAVAIAAGLGSGVIGALLTILGERKLDQKRRRDQRLPAVLAYIEACERVAATYFENRDDPGAPKALTLAAQELRLYQHDLPDHVLEAMERPSRYSGRNPWDWVDLLSSAAASLRDYWNAEKRR